jgi:hypothetical protein
MRTINFHSTLMIVAMTLISGEAHARTQDDNWRFTIQPYVMAPVMDGKAAVRGHDANVDVSVKDVIDNFNIGFLGYVEAAKGDLAFGVDTNYMDLDATKDDRRTSANVSQTMVQPMIFFRVSNNLELLGGARYNAIELSLESRFPAIDGSERKKDWVDPLVGIRMKAPLGASTDFTFLTNVGGFGIGSDFAIQVRPTVNFGVSSSTTIDVGYQLFYMKYDKGSGSDRLLYDVVTQGPIVGATFRF